MAKEKYNVEDVDWDKLEGEQTTPVYDDNIVPEITDDFAYDFDETLDPIQLGVETQQYGLGYPLYKMSDVDGVRIVVYGIKKVASTKKKEAYYYFCKAGNSETGERFNICIGAASILEHINVLTAQGLKRPFSFIPRLKVGGRFGKYWVAE